MKITINRQNGIISLPDNFIILEDITDDGRFSYSLRYNVDVSRAVKEQAFFVKIHVSSRSPDYQDVPGFSNLNASELVDNILNRTRDSKELARSFAKNYIVSITSDITARIPNNQAKSLSTSNIKRNQKNHDSVKLTEKPSIFQKTKFQLVKNSELTSKNIAQPNLQTPVFQVAQESTSTSSIKEHSFNLLLEHGIDPSVVGNKTKAYGSVSSAYAGLSHKLKGVAREITDNSNSMSSQVQAKLGLLTSILGSPKDKFSDQNALSPNDYTSVIVKELSNSITIKEELLIPIGQTPDQFYIILELQNLNGVELETISGVVHHTRNLSIFTIPIVPPFISVAQLSGYNRLELKQLDPNAVGVFIYRKVLEAHSAITEADYVLVDKIALRTSDGVKQFVDRFSSIKTTIYRVIAYNRADMKSPDFSSVILQPRNTNIFNIRKPANKRMLFVLVNAKIINKTIQLEIGNIPPGVVSCRIYRRDLSRFQSLENSDLIGKTILIASGDAASSSFFTIDENPIDQRIYEYSVLLVFRDGIELWSTNKISIQYNPILNNVIETRTSPLSVVNSGVEIDIKFKINSILAEGKYDQIKKAMEQQGLLGFFQNDITTNREKLQNLVAYQIKRTNLTTGEVENMGIFLGTDFSDKAVGKNLAVKPLVSSQTYEYTIVTHFRSAHTLIETYLTEITNKNNPEQNYSFAPSKWQHPVVMQEGTLSSASALKRNHANTDFTFGIVGNIIHARITVQNEPVSIQEISTTSIGPNKILVQWKLKGSTKKIDHFIVGKEEMGMKTIVGKVHSVSETGLFQFLDITTTVTKSRQNPGSSDVIVNESALTYTVVPVFFDYTQGTSIKSSTVFTK